MNYSERIKTLREGKGFTQAELAEKLGCSRQIIIRWENGLSIPSTTYAKKLADCFGMTVDELMDDGDLEKDNFLLDLPALEPTTMKIKNKSGIFPVVVISVLSFLPVILFYVLDLVNMAVYQRLWLEGFTKTMEYRQVTDLLENGSKFVCFCSVGILFAVWCGWLVSKFVNTVDKYERHDALKLWSVGNIFIMTNLIALCYFEFTLVSGLWFGFVYVGSASIALCADGLIMGLFGVFGKKYILFESNRALKKLKLTFFIVRAVIIAVVSVYLIYAFNSASEDVINSFVFTLLFFVVACIVVEIAYLIARVNLRK